MKLTLRILLFIMVVLPSGKVFGQDAALKTNLLGWAGTNVNLGIEFAAGRKSTLQAFASVNPWEFGEDKHFRFWIVEPEYRYWFCGKFNGWFIGAHLLGGQYNAKNMNFPLKTFIISTTVYDSDGTAVPGEGWPDLKGDNSGRHAEGWFIGGGITGGYQWILSKHWNLEASLGLGYAYSPMTFCGRCKRTIDKRKFHYLGPTKAAVSLMYVF